MAEFGFPDDEFRGDPEEFGDSDENYLPVRASRKFMDCRFCNKQIMFTGDRIAYNTDGSRHFCKKSDHQKDQPDLAFVRSEDAVQRTEFAKAAMAAYIMSGKHTNPDEIAALSWEMADAMINTKRVPF